MIPSSSLLLSAFLATHSFDPTALKCSLGDSHLISRISFSYDKKKNLNGELDNYSIKPDGMLTFISGALFFDLQFRDGVIRGHSGDPRGVVTDFSFTRRGEKNTGNWVYLVTQSGGHKDRAIFKCLYNDGK